MDVTALWHFPCAAKTIFLGEAGVCWFIPAVAIVGVGIFKKFWLFLFVTTHYRSESVGFLAFYQ